MLVTLRYVVLPTGLLPTTSLKGSAMPLTDSALRTAKSQAKLVKLSDGGAILLERSQYTCERTSLSNKVSPSPRRRRKNKADKCIIQYNQICT